MFNSFGQTETTYGGGKNIWHEIKGQFPIGGTIDPSSYSEGDVIPAGSMCYLDESAHTITVVKKADTTNLTKVNGLLMNDVVVDANAKGTNGNLTGSVVFAGEIYIDRVPATDKDEATIKSNLPMIQMIHEA